MILHSTRVRLPFGFAATFNFTDDRKLGVEWEPDLPRMNAPRARRKLFDAYSRARNAFMADVATMLGGPLIVASVTGRAELDGFDVIEPRARQWTSRTQ